MSSDFRNGIDFQREHCFAGVDGAGRTRITASTEDSDDGGIYLFNSSRLKPICVVNRGEILRKVP